MVYILLSNNIVTGYKHGYKLPLIVPEFWGHSPPPKWSPALYHTPELNSKSKPVTVAVRINHADTDNLQLLAKNVEIREALQL
jgi:hypothetical protein